MGVFADVVETFKIGRLSASRLNKLANALIALTTAWTPYLGAWTSSGVAPAIGNGAIVSRYRRLGNTTDMFFSVLMGGSTTFGTGFYSFSLPPSVTARATFSINAYATIDDTGSAVYTAVGTNISTTSALVLYGSNTATYVAATSPMTMASGDRIIITATLENT